MKNEKTFRAIVTDKETGKRHILDFSNYTKKDVIHDIRANGYKVNPYKVKTKEVFNFIMDNTNCEPWIWENINTKKDIALYQKGGIMEVINAKEAKKEIKEEAGSEESTPSTQNEIAEIEKAASEGIQISLTKMETEILNAMRENEYDDAYSTGCTWTFSAIDNSGIEPKQARGVISSLIKKDLVRVSGKNDDNQAISYTTLGLKLIESSTGTIVCSWDSPNKPTPKLLKEEAQVITVK